MTVPAAQSEPQTHLHDPAKDFARNTTSDGQNDGREVALEQYLNTIYDPDCDYIDGHLQERNMGEFDHGDVQGQVYFLFRMHFSEWHAKAVVEVRLQVKPTRFLVPDVMVLHPGQTKTQVVREAPLLCVEVLSPEDRWNRLQGKVDDYLAIGVQHIWAFDPSSRESYLCDGAGFHKILTSNISISGTPISLQLADIFSVLDSE